MNRKLIVTLFLTTIFLTGCNNMADGTDSSNSGASAVKSGIEFQEKAKQAAGALNEDPLKGLDPSVNK